MSKPDFMKPRVFKGANGKYLIIVYNNREETFDFAKSTSFKEMTEDRKTPSDPNPVEYTRYDAIRLCKDSGMKEVHFADEIKAHGIICKCGDIDKSIDMGIKGCKCKIVNDHKTTLQELDVDFVELKRR